MTNSDDFTVQQDMGLAFDSEDSVTRKGYFERDYSLKRFLLLSALFLSILISNQGYDFVLVGPFVFSLSLASIFQRTRDKPAYETRGETPRDASGGRYPSVLKGREQEAILLLDSQTKRILESSAGAEKLLGYTRKELLEMSLLEFSPHTQPNGMSSRRLLGDRIQEALAGKASVFEWVHKGRDSGDIPCELQLKRASENQNIVFAEIADLRKNGRSEPRLSMGSLVGQQKTDQLAGLAIASASISSSLDLEKVMAIVARQLTQLLQTQVCLISYAEELEQGKGARLTHTNISEGSLPRNFEARSILPEFELERLQGRKAPLQLNAGGNNGNYHAALERNGVKRILLLPIVTKAGMIGVIELQDTRDERFFEEQDLYLAQTLSQQAANAIENAELFGHTKRQLGELAVLKDVATICSEAENEEVLISQAMQRIGEGFDADLIEFLLLSEDKRKLHPHSSSRTALRNLGRKANLLEKGISGRVARSGQAARVDKVLEDDDYLMLNRKTRSELCVPVKLGRELIGVINAESEQEAHFQVDALNLLETLANQMANGIARLRHMEAQERKGKQLEILNQLSSQMSGVLESERLFSLVVENLHRRMKFESSAIFSVDAEQGEIGLEAQEGRLSGRSSSVLRMSIRDKPVLEQAITEQSLVLADKHTLHEKETKRSSKSPNSLMILPLKVYKEVQYLLLLTKADASSFNADEITALKTLAEQLTVSLESISLFEATRRQLQELTVIHAISNAAMSAKSETELLERTTEIIGATLFPDRFGLLLLDETGQRLRLYNTYGDERSDWGSRGLSASEGFFGEVLRSGIAKRVRDVRKEPDYEASEHSIRSALAVPLAAGGHGLGLILAENSKVDAFTKADLRLLSTIAGQIGNAIEKMRLFESEKIQRVHAETLQEVATILGGVDEMGHMTELILDELNRVVPFESASLQMLEGEELVITGVAGLLPEETVGHRMGVKEDRIAHPILFEKQTVRHNDVSKHPSWLSAPGAEKVKSWIGAPLVAHGKCIGVLTVDGYSANQFDREDAHLVSSFAIHAAISIENARLFRETEESYSQTVSALANAIDVRDSYTKGHSQRLAELAIATGRELKVDKRALDDIYWAALLHDIGKIGVPDHILRKPSRLTDEEFEIIKEHPEIGEKIIEPITSLAHIAPVIRAHQERYDGKGYPDGLRKHEIPLAARIISVADAYVAMTDERVYAEAMSVENALKELTQCAGSQFDPEVVKAFITAINPSQRS